MILAGGQAYTIQGNYAVPAHSDVSSTVMAPLYHGPPPAAHPPLTPLPPPPLGAPGHPHHVPGAHHPLAAAVTPSAAAALIALDPLKSNGHLQAAIPPQHLAHMQDVSYSTAVSKTNLTILIHIFFFFEKSQKRLISYRIQ